MEDFLFFFLFFPPFHQNGHFATYYRRSIRLYLTSKLKKRAPRRSNVLFHLLETDGGGGGKLIIVVASLFVATFKGFIVCHNP